MGFGYPSIKMGQDSACTVRYLHSIQFSIDFSMCSVIDQLKQDCVKDVLKTVDRKENFFLRH